MPTMSSLMCTATFWFHLEKDRKQKKKKNLIQCNSIWNNVLCSWSFKRVRREYSARNLKCLHSFVCILSSAHIEFFAFFFPLKITTAFSLTRHFVCIKSAARCIFFLVQRSGFCNSVFICNSLHKTCCKFVHCAFCWNYHKHNYAAGKIELKNHGCEKWEANNFCINVAVAVNGARDSIGLLSVWSFFFSFSFGLLGKNVYVHHAHARHFSFCAN